MRGWVLAIGAGLTLLPTSALTQNRFEPASGNDALFSNAPDLSRAESLRAEAAAIMAEAQALVSAPGPWAATSLWGTQWRPTPEGEIAAFAPATEPVAPYDPDTPPDPLAEAAEEARVRAQSVLEERKTARMREGCERLALAAQAVRETWPADRPGRSLPLRWLALDANVRCEAEWAAFTREIADLVAAEDGMDAPSYRAALDEHLVAVSFGLGDFETEQAWVTAELGAYDTRWLRRARETLGPDHPELADVLLTVNLPGEEQSAVIARHEEAVEIRTRAFGPHDYRTHDAIRSLATVLVTAERYDEAAALDQRIDLDRETGREAENTAVSDQTAGTLFGLVLSYGNIMEAQQIAQLAMDRALDQHDREHIEVGFAANRLGMVLLQRGDYVEAERFLTLAAEIVGRDLEPLPVLTLTSPIADQERWASAIRQMNGFGAILSNLAAAVDAQGKVAEAEAAYRRALALRRTLPGSQRSATLVGLGRLLIEHGKSDEGIGLLEEAVALSLTPDYLEEGAGVEARRVLAEWHERSGRLDLAEPLLLDAMAFTDIANAPSEPMAETGLDRHQKGPQLMTALGRVLVETGRREAAGPLFTRANRAHFRRWCPQGDARFAQTGRYDWTYDDPRCQAHPDFTRAVADQARFLQSDRAYSATRAWRHAGDMALGRSRLRYSESADARLDLEAGRAVHQAFVSSAWAASAP